jgi:O-antigen ligase
MAVLTVLILQLWNLKHFLRTLLVGIGVVFGALIAFQIEVVRQVVPSGALLRFSSLIDSVLGTGELDRSSSARIDLYRVAGVMFDEKPWLGWGTSSFAHVASVQSSVPDPHYPHNLVLQFVSEFGILGLLVLFWLVCQVAANSIGRKVQGMQLAVVGLAIFAFLNSMVSSGIYENRWMWGMLLMAGAVLSEPYRSAVAKRKLALSRGKRVHLSRSRVARPHRPGTSLLPKT